MLAPLAPPALLVAAAFCPLDVLRCLADDEVGGCLPDCPPIDARLDIPSEFFELRLPVCATYYEEALPAIAFVALVAP